ncbi:MAG: L,D-transpeptidase [Acidimicrobiales bacterium]
MCPRRTTRWALPLLVVAVTLAGCAHADPRPVARAAPAPAPVVTAPATRVTTVPAPPPPAVVATADVAKVAVYPSLGAGGPEATLANPNELGVPLVFLVTSQQPDWLEVMLPMRPNGATGWVRASDVTLSTDDWRMQVELGAHRLTVWKGADVVRQETVAVGTTAAPTPTGDFYLTEVLDTGNPRGAYGPWAFGLSAFSDVYTSFAGGPGQVGLHGTNQPGLLGTDASHGCIRVANDVITALATSVPPGTPISVVS